jgi:hypothetical protein
MCISTRWCLRQETPTRSAHEFGQRLLEQGGGVARQHTVAVADELRHQVGKRQEGEQRGEEQERRNEREGEIAGRLCGSVERPPSAQ